MLNICLHSPQVNHPNGCKYPMDGPAKKPSLWPWMSQHSDRQGDQRPMQTQRMPVRPFKMLQDPDRDREECFNTSPPTMLRCIVDSGGSTKLRPDGLRSFHHTPAR